MANPRTESEVQDALTALADQEQPLTRSQLGSIAGITHLGLVVARCLLSRGTVTIFLNADHGVEIAPHHEVALDSLPESDALARLINLGYGDDQLKGYLSGRDARMRNHG